MKELVKKNRSYRRFYQDHEISELQLMELIDCARLTASSRNIQAIRFMIFNSSAMNNRIFPNLSWAGYIQDWDGPVEGERPSAYIVLLGDTTLAERFDIDTGIVAQTILLTASSQDLGGCMVITMKRQELRQILRIPESFEMLMVIALGKPKEKVILDEIEQDGDIKYWRDADQNHHVPKRKLQDVILRF